jgi:hypothetical protein
MVAELSALYLLLSALPFLTLENIILTARLTGSIKAGNWAVWDSIFTL